MDIVNEKFNYKGRLFPKYKLIEKEGEEMLCPTCEWNEHLNLLKLKRFLITAGINNIPKYGLETYIGCDANKNIPKLKKYCEEFEKTFKNVHLYLWSKVNGTQKTTCAKDILVRLAKNEIQGYFVLMDELLHLLTKSERDDVVAAKVKVLQNAAFLVIDECFTEGQVTLYASGYQKAYLNTFLKSRLEINSFATCFTSNTPINEIVNRWGSGMQSLINRNIPTPMLFDDTIDITRFRNDDIWGDAN